MSQAPDEQMQEQRRLEHLKAMSAYAEADSRQVYLRVTASLTVGVLYLTQLPFARLAALSEGFKICLLGGLAALVLSAISYFAYTSAAAHHARRAIAAAMRDGSNRDFATWWNADSEAPWKSRRLAFRGGDLLFAIGAVLLGVVLAELLEVF